MSTSNMQARAPEWKVTLEHVDGLTSEYRLSDVAASSVSKVAVHVVGCVLPTTEQLLHLVDGSALFTVVRRRDRASRLRPAATVAWIGSDGVLTSWYTELP